MGRPCVSGCSRLAIDYRERRLVAHGPDGAELAVLREGELVTIDGSTGQVYGGKVPTLPASLGEQTEELLTWTSKVQRLRVRANADTPEQARQAREFGADGIGLCRTEHMFFDDQRIRFVREMILAEDSQARQKALDHLLTFQTDDFEQLFRTMADRPVTIRLLDPPLHEFLPKEPGQIQELSRAMGVSVDDLNKKTQALFEFNPMLGHRGVRLAISYPEITHMQVRAILSAACTVKKEGLQVHPEIMVPLAFSRAELEAMRQITDTVARQVFDEFGLTLPYKFGSMIELPRAALLADELAEVAEFFSFGTNDLTQTTLGLSRDDAGSFLPLYVERQILPEDPFVSIDQRGVGELVRIAAEKARVARSGVSLGICGEHGGDPKSIEFCEQIGLSYVSCSPFRVPIARVAAAQAWLRRTKRYWH